MGISHVGRNMIFSPDFGVKNYEFQVGIQRKNMIFSPDFGGKIMNFRWGYKGINI